MRPLLALLLTAGCAAAPPPAAAPPAPTPTPEGLAGAWDMDLSPAQDGSYVQALEIVLDPAKQPGASPTSFTGSVYGGNRFDNGQLFAGGRDLAFAFVSDERGESGGPYYFLGVLAPDARLRGTVRSLTRGFQLGWSATRAATARR